MDSQRQARSFGFPLATALRESLSQRYDYARLRADALAGVTVGIIAVPLAMALAIASGVPPQHGLYTAIIGGMIIALFGGSRLSVSGPTAAFVVILQPIAVQYGLGGLLLATLMAGMILVGMGVARLGRLIQFIPHPVTTGFTAGIAVVIATLQVEDFLGLSMADHPQHYIERVNGLIHALPTVHAPDLAVGLITLTVLWLWPRLKTQIPAYLVALLIATLAAIGLGHAISGFEVETIGSRFSYVLGGETHAGIPPLPPQPVLPWQLPGPDGQPLQLSFQLLEALVGPAVTIALLGAIESLLCAVVADGMSGTKHDPDAELVGQGLGNMLVPFFGGIAATGAIARTATNYRAGAATPIAAVVHGLVVLAVVVSLAPYLAHLPMAALAAMLLKVAWNMSEARHFAHILRVAPRADIAVLLACFGLTVVFDMVIAVSVGIVLAALLFMRRMAEIADARLIEADQADLEIPLPEKVRLYEIRGPLFFGAAEKAASALERTDNRVEVVVLHLAGVPTMDVTGLVALESTIRRLQGKGICVALAGVQAQPRALMEKAGLRESEGKLAICATVEDALARVAERFTTKEQMPPDGSPADQPAG